MLETARVHAGRVRLELLEFFCRPIARILEELPLLHPPRKPLAAQDYILPYLRPGSRRSLLELRPWGCGQLG